MQQRPVVAIIGRPNVGKSALVNRIASTRASIVDKRAGMTRDRVYQDAFWQDRDFAAVDTGGLIFEDDTEFLPHIREQAAAALEEACAAVLVVDGQAGLTALDEAIADWLRRQSVPVLLAVNKCESPQWGLAQAAEFWALDLGEPFPVSGMHGSGVGDLLDALVAKFPPPAPPAERAPINVAIVGRPNVGKSSLLNAISGVTRAIVTPQAGTTRDAIDRTVERQGQPYRLIDTAGIRRKKNVRYGPEFFGINRAFKAIRRADVVVLVLDATEGITEQDLKLAGRIQDQGRAAVIAVNKWDAVAKDSHTIYQFQRYVRDRLSFIDWAEMAFVSATTGKRVSQILDRVEAAAGEHRRRVSTAVLNEALQEAVAWHTPPTNRQGRQGKIYYATQASSQPPTVVLFVNDPRRFPANYCRYIERQLRQQLGFAGTPLRLRWRAKSARALEGSLNRATRV